MKLVRVCMFEVLSLLKCVFQLCPLALGLTQGMLNSKVNSLWFSQIQSSINRKSK